MHENAAALHPDRLVRVLSKLHLVACHCWLLLFPQTLCHDWNGGAVPLVEAWTDRRNVATAACFIGLAAAVLLTLRGLASPSPPPPPSPAVGEGKKGAGTGTGGGSSARELGAAAGAGLGLLALPFLPASNLFVNVGFTLAERVLYTPSCGYCLLVAAAAEALLLRAQGAGSSSPSASSASASSASSSPPSPLPRLLLRLLLLGYISACGTRTWSRNLHWATEGALFASAVDACPGNAQNHWGTATTNFADLSPEQEASFTRACELAPANGNFANSLAILYAKRGGPVNLRRGVAVIETALLSTRAKVDARGERGILPGERSALTELSMNKAQMLTQLYPSRPAAEMDGIVADLVTAGADVLYGVQLQKSNGIVRSEVGLSFCRRSVVLSLFGSSFTG